MRRYGFIKAFLFLIALLAVFSLSGLGATDDPGAFLVTYPRDEIRSLLFIFIFVRVTFIPAAILIVVWFLIQLLNAGEVATVQTGGVAYLAHIGGFIFGAITARLFKSPQSLAEQ